MLISGTAAEISVAELKAHTRYAAGYHPLDRTILRLWAVLDEMDEADRALLVKFVTSCERPPSLGFGDLNPPFTIQVGGGDKRMLPVLTISMRPFLLSAGGMQRRCSITNGIDVL